MFGPNTLSREAISISHKPLSPKRTISLSNNAATQFLKFSDRRFQSPSSPETLSDQGSLTEEEPHLRCGLFFVPNWISTGKQPQKEVHEIERVLGFRWRAPNGFTSRAVNWLNWTPDCEIWRKIRECSSPAVRGRKPNLRTSILFLCFLFVRKIEKWNFVSEVRVRGFSQGVFVFDRAQKGVRGR